MRFLFRLHRLGGSVVVVLLSALLGSIPATRCTTMAFDAVPPLRTALPASTRQALAEKAKQVNPLPAAAAAVLEVTAAGWSNRAATVLTPIHVEPSGVYTADRPFYWNKIDVGCRSTIIELPSSSSSGKPDLWIHTPVDLDGPMMQCIQKLGNVRHICSSNYEHVKFAALWYQSFPDADMWGCPGLIERMPQVRWKGEIPSGYRPNGWKGGAGGGGGNGEASTSFAAPEGMWDLNILQPLHINIEKNPFTGRPFFNEVIFYHAPTKTLLTTDLFWNYPANGVPNSEFGRDDSWELAPLVNDVPLGSRLWKFGMDKVYSPFFNNLMVTDKSEYKAIADHILNVWDVETVIPAHGDILRGKDFIRSVLTKYFQLDAK
jgi:hypothetical protein